MAKLVGPLFSLDARNSIAKTLTYSVWRGVPYARQWFQPQNPQSTKQVNVRTALTLLLDYWAATLTAPQKTAYETGAAGKPLSGFNLYVQRGMLEYVDQIGTATTPASVSVAGNYPSDVFTWS
jgi:hypothetical protein